MHSNKARSWSLVLLAVLLSLSVTGITASPPLEPSARLRSHFYSDVGHVTSILVDGRVLWTGTFGGELLREDTQTRTTLRFPYPAARVPLRALARDGRGGIWAATEGGGLGRFDGQAWTIYDPSNSAFPSRQVRAVIVDREEKIWAATDAGVVVLNGSQWATYTRANSGLVSDNVTALAVRGDVWCGTDSGLSELSVGQWNTQYWTTFQTGNSGLSDDRVTTLALDHEGRLWVGTQTGVNSYGWDEDWLTYPGIAGPVGQILIDGSNTPWFNLGPAVGHLTGCSWTSYDAATIGLETTFIEAIALDPQGGLWAGARPGLAYLEPRGTLGTWIPTAIRQPVSALGWQGSYLWAALSGGGVVRTMSPAGSVRYGTEQGLTAEVRSLAARGQDEMWLGTWGQGVALFQGGRWTYFDTANSALLSSYVNSVAVDASGTVWAGTAAGLAAYQQGAWRAVGQDETGLTVSQVLSVATDKEGRVAAGTRGGGLALFDGRQWKVFDSGNSRIPSDYIQALVFDASGNLWAGTQGSGVARFDGRTWTTYRSGPSGLGGEFVSALAADPQGGVWAGTEDGGLSQFDGCSWTAFDAATSLTAADSVNALAVAGPGQIWVGADQGLLTFVAPPPHPSTAPPRPQKSPPQAPVPAPVPPHPVAQASPDTDRWTSHGVGKSVHHLSFADGAVWAATMGGGAIRWNVRDETFTRFLYPQDGIGSNKVVFTALDPLGRVWLGTQDAGVSVYDGKKWTTYNTGNSGLPHDYANGIAFDPQGRAWLATMGGGVSMFDGQSWTVYNTQNSGLAGDQVWQVAIDPRGWVWAGCLNGLSVFDGEEWVTYPGTSNVHAVAFDLQGRTWFGDGQGINRVEGRKVIPMGYDVFKVSTGDVFALDFDPQGVGWLGTANGIFRFDGQRLVPISTASTGLAGRAVYASAVDPEGRVWFGVQGDDGIASFDGRSWRTYQTKAGPNPLSYDVVSAATDRQGGVWLGTNEGVSVYDGSQWTGYTAHNSGLVDDQVRAIVQDPQGRMWFGTPKGISVFDGATWSTITPETSGLIDADVRALLFDGQGRAWAGSHDGLSVFDGRSWETYTAANSPLKWGDIGSLAEDGLGRIWAGSDWASTVAVLDGDQWTTIPGDEYGLPGEFNSVASITVDSQGRVWLGTSNGLAAFDGQRWTTHSLKDLGGAGLSVYALAADPAGRLWVGGYDGLSRLEDSTWISYTVQSAPLGGNYVGALAVDQKGHVWAGHSEGGASELAPGAKRFSPAAAPVPAQRPTRTRPVRTPTPAPTSTRPVMRPASTIVIDLLLAPIWQQLEGNGLALGAAVSPARQVTCADQRFEQGYMFWRNNDPGRGGIYVLNYNGPGQDAGTWQVYADTWTADQPPGAGLTPPPGRVEPVRGFGKVWRDELRGGPVTPAIGWAIENEQGLDGARYQEFQNGQMLYSPRLNQVFALLFDGTWQAFPTQ